MQHRRVHADQVARLQGELHAVRVKKSRKPGVVLRQVARAVLLGVGQEAGGSRGERHVRVSNETLQGQLRRDARVHVGRVVERRVLRAEPEVVVPAGMRRAAVFVVGERRPYKAGICVRTGAEPAPEPRAASR